MVEAHGLGRGLGGRGFQPSRWLQLTVRLKGMVAPDGAGSQDW